MQFQFSIILASVFGLGVAGFGAEPSRFPIPDEASQAKALAVVKEVYKSDYEKAKTPAQKIALAKKLVSDGIATKDDPVARFVLLRVSRDIAAQQGNLATAFDAINTIGSEYDADQLQMKVDAASTAIKAVKTPKDHLACAVLLAPVIDEAVATDRYDQAKSLAAITLGCARAARDSDLIKQIVDKSKEIEEIAAEFEKVEEALSVLNSAPADPDANEAVGRFLCFVKGEWKRGVAMLALGGDEKLRATALLELGEMPDYLKLGDAWWSYSDSLEGRLKVASQIRAAFWYKQALPTIEGLTKKRVESRVAGVARLLPQIPPNEATPQVITVGAVSMARTKYEVFASSFEETPRSSMHVR